MKQRDLFLGLGVLSAFAASAASPYTGSTVPAEGEADFYLYQVESGKWMQQNTTPGFWTTRAGLDKDGFDLKVIAVEGGYQLDPKFGHNHSVNGDGLYMDTDRAKTVWGITPVTVDGVSNAYQIQMLQTDVERDQYLLGVDDEDLIVDNTGATGTTWQFVTREERLAKLAAAVANGPVDASWVVPNGNFSNADDRNNEWTLSYVDNGPGIGNDGVMHNRVREAWNNALDYFHYITITDLPNGTYRVRFNGYQRENWENEDTWTRYNAGEAPKWAKYFAGASEHDFMHIADEQFDGTEGFDGDWSVIEALDGRFIPNSQSAAASAFLAGRYQNDWIEAVVTDGELTLGVIKREGAERDWLVYDNVQIEYVSTATPAVDLTALRTELTALVTEAEALPTTPGIKAAIDKAREAINGTSATALREGYFELLPVVAGVSSAKVAISTFNETLKFVPSNADTTEAWQLFNSATTKSGFEDALKKLRFARRRAVAKTHEDIFTGAELAEGEYYLYNVGQKQFLCGGSDWGAHAALGYAGTLIRLEDCDAENGSYHIWTGLNNGDGKEYLGYRGYMDTAKAGGWKFTPVDGKTNVYTIEQADYAGVYMAWNYNASVDQHQGNETTVGTENRDGLDPNNLNAQWKLVTRTERDALAKKATLDAPVDMSFHITSPSFSQRENIDEWVMSNFSVWARGTNYNDFVVESWNVTGTADMSQFLSDMPSGVYTLWVNGYYRNGDHADAVNNPDVECPFIYATDDIDVMAYLPSILSESGKAPGEGASVVAEDGTEYYYPQYCNQAADWFRSGLYETHMTFVNNEDTFIIGVMKEFGVENDWTVVDNFRLEYYGADTTVEDVEAKIAAGIEDVTVDTAVEFKGDDRIFNLQGIQVANPTAPGIYIQNGKKFVVR